GAPPRTPRPVRPNLRALLAAAERRPNQPTAAHAARAPPPAARPAVYRRDVYGLQGQVGRPGDRHSRSLGHRQRPGAAAAQRVFADDARGARADQAPDGEDALAVEHARDPAQAGRSGWRAATYARRRARRGPTRRRARAADMAAPQAQAAPTGDYRR